MSVQVKFCGMRRMEDIVYANECRPDYIGLVFAESRRQVTIEQAKNLIRRLDPQILAVGVFVNEPLDHLLEIQKETGLSVVQLHGEEDASYIYDLRRKSSVSIWKAVRVRKIQEIQKAQELEVDALLLDAFTPGIYGGTGCTANWTKIQGASCTKNFFLAGGLRESNLERAVQIVNPYGVDVSGGIETNGVKDPVKMRAIMKMIRNLERKEQGREVGNSTNG